MKKQVAKILTLLLLLVCALSLFGCDASTQRYEFTHTNGHISSFTFDFNNNTAKYEGVCVWQTKRLGKDYGKGNVGMTEKCNGVLVLTEDYGNGQKFYDFKSTNADVNWEMSFSMSGSRNYIRCYFGNDVYEFYKK